MGAYPIAGFLAREHTGHDFLRWHPRLLLVRTAEFNGNF